MISFLRSRYIGHSRFANTVSSLVVINLVIAGLGFATRITLANNLSKEAFGDFAFAIALGNYGVLFVQFGLDKSFVAELARFPNRTWQLVSSSLVLRLILFVVFVSVYLIAASIFIETKWPVSIAIIVVVYAFFAFNLASTFDALHETSRQGLFYLFERLAYFAVIWLVLFIPAFALSLRTIAIALLLSAAIGMIPQYRWMIPKIRVIGDSWTWPSVKLLARSSVWVWLAAIFGLSLEVLNPIILRQISGSERVAEYSAGWTLVMLALLVVNQVGRVGKVALSAHLQPEYSVSDQVKFLARYTFLMVGVGLVLSVAIFLLAERIIQGLFPEDYSGSAAPLRILSWYPLIFAPYLVALQYLIAVQLQRTYFGLIVITSALSVGMSIVLINRSGSDGAAVALLGSMGLGLVLFVIAVLVQLRSVQKSSGARST
jgi:polysaccharide transporter, PST family